jgi:hypothetical protein
MVEMSWEFSWVAIQWDAMGMNDGDSTEFNTDFMEFWYIQKKWDIYWISGICMDIIGMNSQKVG